ncbi:acyl carrier protein [Hymenobacter rubripertinctus]|nr:acyl carrier protein [Hymenobacter rubripertinctus]
MSNADAVYQEIVAILADVAECEVEDIKPDTNLPEELGLNSLMGLEVLVSLERKFKIKISESELARMTTAQDIYATVQKVLATEVAA